MSLRAAALFGPLCCALSAACTRDEPPSPAGTATEQGTAPYEIVSPSAGDRWEEGSSHVIRWVSRRPGAVNVGAVVDGKDKGHLALQLAAGTDSLQWTVPGGFVSGFGPQRSDSVRIRIEDAGNPAIGVTSAAFTVAAPNH